MDNLTKKEKEVLELLEKGEETAILLMEKIDEVGEEVSKIGKNFKTNVDRPEKESSRLDLKEVETTLADILKTIEKLPKEVSVKNDVTGLVDKVISKINLENNIDLSPLLEQLEQIKSAVSEKDEEIDYTELLKQIEEKIPSENNIELEKLSKKIDTFVERFEKLVEKNRLKVEVDRIGGGGGGGGVSASELRALTLTTTTPVYNTQFDDVSTTSVIYIGKAPFGSATSSAVWQVKKIDQTGTPITTTIKYAGGGNFTNIWDNRTSLTYT